MNMRGRPYTAANPFVQIASLLVFVLMVIGAVFVGAVILSLLLGAGAILALIVAIRSWWLGRGLRAGGQRPEASGDDGHAGRVIDVSYTVVEKGSGSYRQGRNHGTDDNS